jgi:hypothetical protein
VRNALFGMYRHYGVGRNAHCLHPKNSLRGAGGRAVLGSIEGGIYLYRRDFFCNLLANMNKIENGL